MTLQQEIKKLNERNAELEFIKDLQHDIIADFELTTRAKECCLTPPKNQTPTKTL